VVLGTRLGSALVLGSSLKVGSRLGSKLVLGKSLVLGKELGSLVLALGASVGSPLGSKL
jgi:hypothetical protein